MDEALEELERRARELGLAGGGGAKAAAAGAEAAEAGPPRPAGAAEEAEALLERIRRGTADLHQLRGDWEKPGERWTRDWNGVPEGPPVRRPLEDADYAAYKTYKAKERRHGRGGALPAASSKRPVSEFEAKRAAEESVRSFMRTRGLA